MEKHCASCKQIKPVDEFPLRWRKQYPHSWCKACYKERNNYAKRKYRERGGPALKEKAKQAVFKRKAADPEKYKQQNKASCSRAFKNRCSGLTDSYIINGLKEGTSLKREDIPQELIEAKRAYILLLRQLKGQK